VLVKTNRGIKGFKYIRRDYNWI